MRSGLAETSAEEISQYAGISRAEGTKDFLSCEVVGDSSAFELVEQISKKLTTPFSGVGMVAPVAAESHERGTADAVPVETHRLPLLVVAGQIDEAGGAAGRRGDV